MTERMTAAVRAAGRVVSFTVYGRAVPMARTRRND